jgi:hypothetical protein
MSSTPAPPPPDEGRGRKAGQCHCELLERLSPSSSPGSTGRSSIPETSRLSTNVSGILGAPLKAGHDSGGDAGSHSRGALRPSFCYEPPSSYREGAGKAGCPHAPMVRVQKKARGRTTGTGGSTGLPCAMVLRLIRNLPGDRAFLPPSSA